MITGILIRRSRLLMITSQSSWILINFLMVFWSCSRNIKWIIKTSNTRPFKVLNPQFSNISLFCSLKFLVLRLKQILNFSFIFRYILLFKSMIFSNFFRIVNHYFWQRFCIFFEFFRSCKAFFLLTEDRMLRMKKRTMRFFRRKFTLFIIFHF